MMGTASGAFTTRRGLDFSASLQPLVLLVLVLLVGLFALVR